MRRRLLIYIFWLLTSPHLTEAGDRPTPSPYVYIYISKTNCVSCWIQSTNSVLFTFCLCDYFVLLSIRCSCCHYWFSFKFNESVSKTKISLAIVMKPFAIFTRDDITLFFTGKREQTGCYSHLSKSVTVLF
jgi:hypothetical protein